MYLPLRARDRPGATRGLPYTDELSCLTAYGCLFCVPQRYSDVRSVMKRGVAAIPEREPFIEQFLATEAGRALERLWAAGLRSAFPQQLGLLIGGAIHALRSGEPAELGTSAAR